MSIGKCSFCGMTKEIMEGKDSNICLDCCNAALESFEPDDDFDTLNIDLKPHEIKEKLDEYIVGQNEAKQILSVAVYNHYKRIKIKSDTRIQKSNILLIGPTGSGKTYIMQTLANILNTPFAIVDANTFTEAGYVGDDVSSILKKLYFQAEGDIELLEKGIVYVDEVDKLVSKIDNHNARDVNGTGVQQAFLKMMEGGEQTFQLDQGGSKNEVTVNTDNILFVFGGAFIGLNKVIDGRINKKTSIGFGSTPEPVNETNDTKNITQTDLIKYGFIPEFVGRIPIIVEISQLTKDELKMILTKPKDAIVKQYKTLIKADGVSVKFDDSAINYIVEEANKKALGARGLRGIIDKSMNILMYELPKYPFIKKMTITKELLDHPENEFKKIVDDNKKELKAPTQELKQSQQL